MQRTLYPRLTFEELREGLLPIIDHEVRSGRSLPGTERLRALEHRGLAAALRRCGVYRFYRDIRADVFIVARTILRSLVANGRFPTRHATREAGWVTLTSLLRRIGFRRWGDVAASCGYPTVLSATRDRYDRRRRAAQRLIWIIVQRERKLPGIKRFSRRVGYLIQHRGGVRAMMRDFLRIGCPPQHRAWLSALVTVKRRRKPWRWWKDEARLKRALEPYVELYVASGGRLNVVAKLRSDGRDDLINAGKSYGRHGVYALFRGWGVMERLGPIRLRRVQRELAVAYPHSSRRRVLPSSKRVQRERPKLNTRILNCGGYAEVARALNLQTAHQARYSDSRRRKLQAIGRLLLKYRNWPPQSALHTRLLETVKNGRGGVVGFLRIVAADPDLEADLLTVVEKLRALSRNGAAPTESHRLRQIANQLCTMLPPRVT